MINRVSVFMLSGLAFGIVGGPAEAQGSRSGTVVVSGPRLVVVVGTDLRYCDECDEDVFFHMNYWYAYRSGGWYRRGNWGAPWVIVRSGSLPEAFIKVPPGRFKHRYGAHHPAYSHHPKHEHWQRGHAPRAGSGDRGREQVRDREQDGDQGDGKARSKGKNKKKKKGDSQGRGQR